MLEFLKTYYDLISMIIPLVALLFMLIANKKMKDVGFFTNQYCVAVIMILMLAEAGLGLYAEDMQRFWTALAISVMFGYFHLRAVDNTKSEASEE
jgi:hypothetical protein